MLPLMCGAVALVSATAMPASVAHEPPARRARVDLLSETTGVQPSARSWLGIRVTLSPGWHTYWVNPGDSGAPARVAWTLPPGMRAGDIVWPAPHRLSNPPFADYGYENEVLWLVPVEVEDLGPRGSVSLTADVRLLVCKDVCVSERSTASITLPVTRATTERPEVAALFAAARRRVPRPVPDSWRLEAQARERAVVLTIHAAQPPRALEFFPLRPLVIRHAAPQPYERLERGAHLTLEVDERLREPPSRLTGVLVLDDEQSVAVDVPVGAERTR